MVLIFQDRKGKEGKRREGKEGRGKERKVQSFLSFLDFIAIKTNPSSSTSSSKWFWGERVKITKHNIETQDHQFHP